MNYLEAVKHLKKNKLTSVILIYGEEQFLIESIVHQISKLTPGKTSGEDKMMHYDLEETTISDVLLETETYPFFSDHKLVVADPAFFFTAKQVKTQVTHDLTHLLAYLEQPVDFSTLVLIVPYKKLDERKKITKQIKKHALTIHCAKVKAWEIDKWIDHMTKDHQIVLEREAKQLLMNEAGTHLGLLEKEIDKLALYVGENGTVTSDIAQALVSPHGNATGLTLVDMVINKDLKGAIKVYRDLMLLNEEPIALIGLLASQLRTIYQVKILLRKGYHQQQLVKHLKVHPYVIKMSVERERKFTLEKLYQSIEACAQADQTIKQGKMDKILAFEFLLYQLIQL